jgi:hypothetical protein
MDRDKKSRFLAPLEMTVLLVAAEERKGRDIWEQQKGGEALKRDSTQPIPAYPCV